MPFIVLCKGGAYNFKEGGITLINGTPVEVSDEQAAMLLQRAGKFKLIQPEEAFSALATDSSVPANFAPPKNALRNDDLNGQRILLKRQGGIGDAVFVVQCAQYIKQQYPGAYIAIAAADNANELVGLCDCVDEVLSIAESSTADAVHRFQYIINFAGIIEARQIDDLDYFEAHFERMGITDSPPPTMPHVTCNRIALQFDLQQRAQAVLNAQGIGSEPYVAFITGTSNPLKRVHYERMKEIVEGLASSRGDNQPRLHVLCLSGKHPLDRKYTTKNAYIGSYVSEDCALSAELCRRARVVIGADTGLTHFAASIGVPTVSLWGPTDCMLSMDHMPAPKRMFNGHKHCQPCRVLKQARCPFFKGGYADCMCQLNSDDIIAAVHDLMAAHPEHAALALDATKVINRNADTYTAPALVAKDGRAKVAVLIDHGKHYTGGGMYAFTLARMLSRNAALDVEVHTDTDRFVYAQDFKDVKVVKTLVANKELKRYECSALDDSYSIVIATPPFAGTIAKEWKQANPDGIMVCLVYETPNYIAQYRTGLDAEEKYWAAYKEALLASDYAWVISKPVKEALKQWLGDECRLTSDIVAPVVHDEVADTVLAQALPRERRVVIISRAMWYKRVPTAVDSIAHTLVKSEMATKKNPYEIIVIGDDTPSLAKKVGNHAPAVTVKFVENCNEVDKWQYIATAQAVVHASEFEGFGIPLAEAMYGGTPVVCPPLEVYKRHYGEQPFYYEHDNELGTSVAEIVTAWESPGSPEFENLALYLHAARAFVKTRYVYAAAIKRLDRIFAERKHFGRVFSKAEKEVVEAKHKSLAHIRVAYVTSWGTQCGIAETARTVLDNINVVYKIFAAKEPESRIIHTDDRAIRCWERTFISTVSLRRELLEFAPNVVHFHHEYSFYRKEENLLALFRDLRALGIKVVVTLHTYIQNTFTDILANEVDAVVLTKPQPDMPGNHYVIDLPAMKAERLDIAVARTAVGQRDSGFMVGTYGMWNSHKGYKEFLGTYGDVTAFAGDKLRYLTLGYADPKNRYQREVTYDNRAFMESGRWIRKAGYHTREQVMQWLCACNALVFNYNVIGHYSASAALRDGMASGRPCIVTNSPMFTEFNHEEHVLKVDFGDHKGLVDAIRRLYEDPKLGQLLVHNCDEYLDNCEPRRVAQRHEELYETLLAAPPTTNEDN